ncbi:MAG: AtpZ/AtpI family protein [Candidatus Latescibacteria bacterium]|nr:AtpZ/AtpI family protein [Candidatus Latescibacterota bacterium]
MPLNKKKETQSFRLVGELSVVGLTIVIATTIGYFVGYWIGGNLGNSVWGGAIGGLTGAAAGFMEMFRTIKRYIQLLNMGRNPEQKDG